MNRAIILFAASLYAMPQAHAAADAIEAPKAETAQSRIDLAFGLALTSNYISHGSTESDDKPAIQGYFEASYGIFYLGAWASNVSYDGAKDVENDIYAGIRPTFGDLSLDLGYVRYVYSNDPIVSGEAYLKATYAITSTVTPGVEFYYDPTNETSWSAATIEVGGLPWEMGASGQVGSEFGTEDAGYTGYAWDAGVFRTFLDETVKLDLRYHDANDDDARVAVTLSYDFSTAE